MNEYIMLENERHESKNGLFVPILYLVELLIQWEHNGEFRRDFHVRMSVKECAEQRGSRPGATHDEKYRNHIRFTVTHSVVPVMQTGKNVIFDLLLSGKIMIFIVYLTASFFYDSTLCIDGIVILVAFLIRKY